MRTWFSLALLSSLLTGCTLDAVPQEAKAASEPSELIPGMEPMLPAPPGYLVFTIHTEHNTPDVVTQMGYIEDFLSTLAPGQHVTIQLQTNFAKAIVGNRSLRGLVEKWKNAGHELGIHKHAYLHGVGSDCYTNNVADDCLLHKRENGDPCSNVLCQTEHGVGSFGTNRDGLTLLAKAGVHPKGGGISMKSAAEAFPDRSSFRVKNSRSEFHDFVCSGGSVASCLNDGRLVYLNHNFSSHRCFPDDSSGRMSTWVRSPPCEEQGCSDPCTLALSDQPTSDGVYCSGIPLDPVKVAVDDKGFSYFTVGIGSKVFAYPSSTDPTMGGDAELALASAEHCLNLASASSEHKVVSYTAHSYNLPAVDTRGRVVAAELLAFAKGESFEVITQSELIELKTGARLGTVDFSASGLPAWPYPRSQTAGTGPCQCSVDCNDPGC